MQGNLNLFITVKEALKNGILLNLLPTPVRRRLWNSLGGWIASGSISILQTAGRLLKSMTETSIKYRWTPYKKAVFCIEIALIIHYLG